ncbi:class I SAM-dependent methyltransferase [Schlesneria paludicola]|uniref:class I SAM-dependent methyltransferase n=1 Tax=Schlesneria paludicola TaxID=360056 RepID=UPI0003146793|nr:class I SAM-dependent methyltransferase [Schlesneria paludicola]
MNWRGSQAESRRRYLVKYDAEEVDRYDAWLLQRTREDEDACLADIASAFQFQPGMSVLDVGAGAGTLCRTLALIPGLSLTALEPSPAMRAKLQAKHELQDVVVVDGFCDSDDDRLLFDQAAFDVIVSRQLANGLFDPLAAFRNWRDWLKPGGSVLLIDGLFDRTDWAGRWQEEVDVLPQSACRTMAMVPYLLEQVGFQIESVGLMNATNAMSSATVVRYLVVASKPTSSIRSRFV